MWIFFKWLKFIICKILKVSLVVFKSNLIISMNIPNEVLLSFQIVFFFVISRSVWDGIIIYHFIIILVEKTVDTCCIRASALKALCILSGAHVSQELKLWFCYVILFSSVSSFLTGGVCHLKTVSDPFPPSVLSLLPPNN
jgi:hypothetical protein